MTFHPGTSESIEYPLHFIPEHVGRLASNRESNKTCRHLISPTSAAFSRSMCAAEARYGPHKIRGVDKPFGFCAVGKGNRDEAPEAAHLLPCQHVPWIFGQTWI